jgi:rSAM/selenodomain-associated transferase 1
VCPHQGLPEIMSKHDTCVIIFTKSPEKGKVKTRLIPELGEDKATELYRELLTQTVELIGSVTFSDIKIYVTPDINHPFIKSLASKTGALLYKQEGDDLGHRMYQAISSSLDTHKHVIVIGCDCPELQENDLHIARIKLSNDADIVIGPSDDGGYYLIGCNSNYPEIFNDINWGTEEVLSNTLQKAKKENLKVELLDEKWDVDTGKDLLRYHKLISGEQHR